MLDHSTTDRQKNKRTGLFARRTKRRRRIFKTILGLVITFVVGAVVATFIQIPYYAIVPGSGIDVASLIHVNTTTHAHKGAILLTDVELVPLRAIEYPFYKLNSNAEIIPNSNLTGSATASQYNAQGVVDMINAREAATVAGLNVLGFDVHGTPDGVFVYQPLPGSPASRFFSVGEVITRIENQSVATTAGLRSVLARYKPGSRVAVSYHPLASTKTLTKSIVVGAPRNLGGSSRAAITCGEVRALAGAVHVATGGAGSCIGAEVEQDYRTTGAPFAVTINNDGIVGPSAGLAFTLGLVNKLNKADLTAGQRIAATGTMSIDGDVGDVGGVAQKTVAVRQAGATVFFVPPQGFATAKAHAGSQLKVFAASNVHQAIRDLESLGGRLVRPTTRTTSRS